MLGNYLTVCIGAANYAHVDILTAVIRLLPHFAEIIRNGFQLMDLVFYAISAYFGYKYAITRVRRPAMITEPDEEQSRV